jgi:hypothetical protein
MQDQSNVLVPTHAVNIGPEYCPGAHPCSQYRTKIKVYPFKCPPMKSIKDQNRLLVDLEKKFLLWTLTKFQVALKIVYTPCTSQT